jgi:hypothetical protein
MPHCTPSGYATDKNNKNKPKSDYSLIFICKFCWLTQFWSLQKIWWTQDLPHKQSSQNSIHLFTYLYVLSIETQKVQKLSKLKRFWNKQDWKMTNNIQFFISKVTKRYFEDPREKNIWTSVSFQKLECRQKYEYEHN